MRVLIFHPSLLPPKDYGGVERVVLWLAKGLQECGHEVGVAAFPGSQLPMGVRLIEVDPSDCSDRIVTRFSDRFDLIHFMAPPRDFSQFPEASSIPWLVTIHGNGQKAELFPKNSVFLSRDHAQRHGASRFVYNGIDPEEYVFDPLAKQKNAHVCFLSKTSWKVKNLRRAMELCRIARVELEIAGGNRPLGLRARAWLSQWGASPQTWIGPVSGKVKAEFLCRSRALVFPVQWPEPFGLVMAEAMISGTPVIGTAIGSVPELVGKPGGIALPLDNEAEWVTSIQSALKSRWDPEACRAWALEMFHYRKMTASYLAIYQEVIGGKSLHSHQPQSMI